MNHPNSFDRMGQMLRMGGCVALRVAVNARDPHNSRIIKDGGTMIRIRKATVDDINSILMLRYNAVDNKLRNPITFEMIFNGLQTNCQAWVAEEDEVVVGFSLANRKSKTVWGLFILPGYHGRGLGKKLLHEATEWLRVNAKTCFFLRARKIWLDTAEGGAAEAFYAKMGWKKGRKLPNHEVRYWYYFSDR